MHLRFLHGILEFGCCCETFTLWRNQITTWMRRTMLSSGKAFWDSSEDRQPHTIDQNTEYLNSHTVCMCVYHYYFFLKQKLSDLTILSLFLRNLLLASAGFRMTFQLRQGRKRGSEEGRQGWMKTGSGICFCCCCCCGCGWCWWC